MSDELGRLALPAESGSPARARDWAEPILAAHLADTDDAVLCVSELVSNAVIHAATRCVLTIERSGDVLRVSVRDDVPEELPVERDASRLAVTGRGLRMVAQLVDEGGVDRLDDAKVVWFEVRATAVGAGSVPPPLTTRMDPVPVGSAVLAMPRALDLASAPTFAEVLAAAVAGADDLVVLDGSGVEFIDSTGVGVVVSAYERSHADGRTLSIVNPSQPLARTLETLGNSGLLVSNPERSG